MVVASIYCIVIIYIPSVEEQNSKILPEPKRCVTTQVTWPDIHHEGGVYEDGDGIEDNDDKDDDFRRSSSRR